MIQSIRTINDLDFHKYSINVLRLICFVHILLPVVLFYVNKINYSKVSNIILALCGYGYTAVRKN